MQGKFFFMPSLFSFVLVFSMFFSQAFAAVGSVEHSGRGLHELSEVSSSVQPEPKSEAEPEPEPETEPELGRAVEQAGRIITLDDEVTKVEQFVLDEGDTLLIDKSSRIVAARSIIIRGTVRVEQSDDASEGTRGPWLGLVAGETIVILGEMSFADGLPGISDGAMGGTGGSLFLKAPIIAIGTHALTMGDGGDGGPNAEGGGGGIFGSVGTVLPFHDDGLTIHGGRGGDGGDGSDGTPIHPRGHRGEDGGLGGTVDAQGPGAVGIDDFNAFAARAFGLAPELDPFIRLHRLPPTGVTFVSGDGGDGGNGGEAYEIADPATEAGLFLGGGLGGAGGEGGFAHAPWGLPAAPVIKNADGEPTPQTERQDGHPGGTAIGGRGGNGGNAGKGPSIFKGRSLYAVVMGGRGGNGGRIIGGNGGDALKYPFGKDSKWAGRWQGRPGVGGGGQGGRGGKPGAGPRGADGGDGGDGQAGNSGKLIE
jgi:hypothetical protein